MNAYKFFGIYPETIEMAAEMCEAAMEKLGFTVNEIDDMYDFAKQDFEEIGSLDDITNSIIYCLFHHTDQSILEKFPTLRVDYYVNGCCSSFDVDDLPGPMTEEEIREDWEEALNTMDYSDISGAVQYGFSPDDLRKLMQLHKADKHREKIEDLLTDCNFHTECAALCEEDYAEAERLIREMEARLSEWEEE